MPPSIESLRELFKHLCNDRSELIRKVMIETKRPLSIAAAPFKPHRNYR